MLTLSVAVDSQRERQIHRWATAWVITRTDGTVFRFTDHDIDLPVGANTYVPAGGFDASARQKKIGIERAANLEVRGIVTSGAITEADLRAGRYRNATVDEYMIDWRYPWLGLFAQRSYTIMEVKFSTNGWQAAMESVAAKLRQQSGRTYQRKCPYDLGEPIQSIGPGQTGGCGVTLSTFTESVTVTTVDSNYVRFRASTLSSQVDNYWRHGVCTWTSGLNNGLSFEVQNSTNSTLQIKIFLDTPEIIAVGDTFDVYAGCDKELTTCGTKFSNVVNYGGYPWVPGGDKAMSTPNIPDG